MRGDEGEYRVNQSSITAASANSRRFFYTIGVRLGYSPIAIPAAVNFLEGRLDGRSDAEQKAARIAALFRERRQIDVLPDELYPASLDEAYAIRAAYEAVDAAGPRGPVAGYKIAITTKVMQELCGIDEPCYGAIFAPRGASRHRAAARRRLLPDGDRDRDRGAARRGPARGRRPRPGRRRGRVLHGGDRADRGFALRLQAARRARPSSPATPGTPASCSGRRYGLAPARPRRARRAADDQRQGDRARRRRRCARAPAQRAGLARQSARRRGQPAAARAGRDDRQPGRRPNTRSPATTPSSRSKASARPKWWSAEARARFLPADPPAAAGAAAGTSA